MHIFSTIITENVVQINNNKYSGKAIINDLQPSPVSITVLSDSVTHNEGLILNWKCIQCCPVIQITGANFTGFNQLYFANDTIIKNRAYYVGLNEMYAISFSGTHWKVGNITSNDVQQDIISSSEKRNLSFIRNNHTKPCPGQDNQWEEMINSNQINAEKLTVDCHCEFINLIKLV